MNDGANAQEIIIVKRSSDGEDGHHGGAWKIAFADFMTAMMALFLVLWLVNAANEQTRKAVASYFNPVKLVDRSRGDKGVNDAGGPANVAADEVKAATEPPQPKVALDIPALDDKAEETLFANPEGTLDTIAAQYEQHHGSGEAPVEAKPESPTDPFAAQYWERQAEEPLPAAKAEASAGEEGAGSPDASRFGEGGDAKPAAEEALKQKAEAVGTEIKAALGEALGGKAPMVSEVAVTVQDNGVLISVTDDVRSPMFRIGSAVPNGELVVAMGKIGEVLARHPGRIRINGHTDGRPFSGGKYDNWRLSTSRAHTAYYMLLRGGLDEARIARVSGFADRDLKDPADPNAGVNRRIEIFLESSP